MSERARLRGVEAVIDKHLTAALLAEALGAERLVLATDVSCVELDWGTAMATPIEAATPSMLRRTRFTPGSMGPKVEAACRFVERTGGVCAIGSLAKIAELVRGSAGTQIVPERIALATPYFEERDLRRNADGRCTRGR